MYFIEFYGSVTALWTTLDCIEEKHDHNVHEACSMTVRTA
jgi:hypothetical protein